MKGTQDKSSFPEDAEIKRVEIDALVILQVMKHCRQHVPNTVSGVLLGLDVEDTLQVTHSFGYAQKQADEHLQEDSEVYQLDMLKRLREVNVDSNTVGWYQTTHLGQFFSEQVIETQYAYQMQIPRTILLVYDPLQSAIGKPAFKAFRLTPEFVKKQTEAREANQSALNDFPSGDMFMEIPISIHSPVIVEAFLVDWCISDPISTSAQLDTLDVENQAFVEKNVQLLISSLQELAEEQQKLQMHERQAARQQQPDKGRGRDRYQRGFSAPPKQLDTMILSQQIQNYCKQINDFAGDSFGKLFLLSNKPGGSAAKK
jgi:translation initiation factor 3 subunit H